MKFARQSTCSSTMHVPHITTFEFSLYFMKNLLVVSTRLNEFISIRNRLRRV